MKKILVFGTFDGLHSGHLYFLKQARKLGDRLVVAIARDTTVKKLKNKTPRHSEKERLKLVQSLKFVDQAVLGDRQISTYKIVKKLKPDIICVGYDQKALAQDLQKNLLKIKIARLRPYKAQKMHTSELK